MAEEEQLNRAERLAHRIDRLLEKVSGRTDDTSRELHQQLVALGQVLRQTSGVAPDELLLSLPPELDILEAIIAGNPVGKGASGYEWSAPTLPSSDRLPEAELISDDPDAAAATLEAAIPGPPELALEAEPVAPASLLDEDRASETEVETSGAEMSSEAAGETGVEVSSETAGETEVEASSETSGETEVEVSSETAGEVEVEASSETSGETGVEVSSETACEVEVEASSETSGELEVEASSETAGETEVEASSETAGETEVEASSELAPRTPVDGDANRALESELREPDITHVAATPEPVQRAIAAAPDEVADDGEDSSGWSPVDVKSLPNAETEWVTVPPLGSLGPAIDRFDQLFVDGGPSEAALERALSLGTDEPISLGEPDGSPWSEETFDSDHANVPSDARTEPAMEPTVTETVMTQDIQAHDVLSEALEQAQTILASEKVDPPGLPTDEAMEPLEQLMADAVHSRRPQSPAIAALPRHLAYEAMVAPQRLDEDGILHCLAPVEYEPSRIRNLAFALERRVSVVPVPHEDVLEALETAYGPIGGVDQDALLISISEESQLEPRGLMGRMRQWFRNT